ncbi:SIR2 family protein [Cellulomonas sp. P24]|uniref:SIR2 family protein n=1 Tax=Cellulomonas sp. P24 TaxID=2885206 RepID=UPI00216AE0CA|nr:SIR2 family protein [Cellulomonas sp. P24]MCR6493167.1 SIR2 family protein [Cellulomonas sp. P24]
MQTAGATMEKQAVYRSVQELFRKGLVTLVGSGASCAHGLPSMKQLAEHLLSTIGESDRPLGGDSSAAWEGIASSLRDGVDLEAAFGSVELSLELSEAIALEVSNCVADLESAAIVEMLESSSDPVFGRLFKHLLRTTESADVITTNYDRLLEVAAALVEIPVDSMFHGHGIGHLDEDLSRSELLVVRANRSGRTAKRSIRLRPHLRLAKPHGSLDWIEHRGRTLKTSLDLGGRRRIIAPGSSKYVLGYEQPFDLQRQRANAAISEASGFLVIGYGFSDSHLQTYLEPQFAKVPALVMSKSLTTGARHFLASNPRAVGFERGPGGGTSITWGAETAVVPEDIWSLDVMIREVLGI